MDYESLIPDETFPQKVDAGLIILQVRTTRENGQSINNSAVNTRCDWNERL
jgi:hypothetical protein